MEFTRKFPSLSKLLSGRMILVMSSFLAVDHDIYKHREFRMAFHRIRDKLRA